MKKGLVMEKHRKYMIVLTRDGMFQKAAPEAGVEIGEEVEFEPLTEKRRGFAVPSLGKIRMPMGLAAVAALLLILAIPIYFLPGKEPETYAYVSIDINPSIELQVDKSMRVKELTPLNKDAETVRGEIGDYEGEDITKVVDHIMIQSEERNLTSHGKNMLVGVTYANDETGNKVSVLKHLREFLTSDAPGWKVAAYQVPTSLRKQAHEKNQSANELMANRMKDRDSQAFTALSKEDREIIQSFYEKKHKKLKEKSTLKAEEEQKKKEQSKKKKQQEEKKQDAGQKQVTTPPVQQQTTPDNGTGRKSGTTPSTTGTPGGNAGSNSGSAPVRKQQSSGSTYRAPQQNRQPGNNNANRAPQQSKPSNNNGNSNNQSNNGNHYNNGQNNYNNNKNYNGNQNKQNDYKNNNPYRNNNQYKNKDYNQYKNRGQQYRNNDEDDDD